MVAAAAIEWGDPILSSSISTVVEGRLYYRGQDAVMLSEQRTFEEVAHLLWGVYVCDDAGRLNGMGWADQADGSGLPDGTTRRDRARHDTSAGGVPKPPVSMASPLQRAFTSLGLRAGVDLSSYGRSLPVLQAEAASVLVTLADAMLEAASAAHDPASPSARARGPALRQSASGLHHRAAASWHRPDAADIVRRALILLAEHELNASTFATRVAVSTGAPLAAGVLSGLATLSGPIHGRASLGVLELAAGVDRVGADVTIRDWLSQGRPIAGFGHPLYPLGDPRATALLQHFSLPAAYAQLSDAVEKSSASGQT